MSKSKYDTNNYILIVFNKIGTKLLSEVHVSHTAAFSSGRKICKGKKEKKSFVVTKVLFNSLIGKKHKWGYYPQEIKHES
jgi:hypothetical protein